MPRLFWKLLIGLFCFAGFAHAEPFCPSGDPGLGSSASCQYTPAFSCRVGEAANPGPAFSVGTSNPSGLRNKEPQVLSLGRGVWSFSETQLSSFTVKASANALAQQARDFDRKVRVLTGHPAPLRPNSLWAGSWTGVLQASDFPCKPLRMNWTPELHATGRILTAQHFVGQHSFVLTTVYGYPAGPTWPDARERTDSILSEVSKAVVFGCKGPRIVVGDFNHSLDSLEQCALWRSLGWVEAQHMAQARWHQPVQHTCKHATCRDFIWLSPEAAALTTAVHVRDVFQEHATVIAVLDVPDSPVAVHEWPQPGEIPWGSVDVGAWHATGCHLPVEGSNSTSWFSRFSRAAERSLDGFVSSSPDHGLPAHCFGRGQRLRPQAKQSFHTPRASRHGEEELRHAGLSREVHRWFKQVRRLQSLVHATASGNPSPSAEDYRCQLWGAILRAKGFRGGFRQWWSGRPVQLVGSLPTLPLGLPSSAAVALIFQDFRQNFRKLECWHLRQKQRVLDAKHTLSMQQLYRELRPSCVEQVDTLTLTHEFAILAVEPVSFQVHLDSEPDARGFSSWSLEGAPVDAQIVDGSTCAVQAAACPQVGQTVEQVQTLVSVKDVQDEFVSLWSPKWRRHVGTPPDTWHRIVSFAQSFLPRLDLRLPPLTVEAWVQALRRLKVRAARGPCGWARDDLLSLPEARTRELLGVLEAIETGRSEWPAQLLEGQVFLLSKRNSQLGTNGFRPICIYSVIYRVWSGLRSRQLLRQLKPYLPSELFGFVPGCEAEELWYSVQLQIEQACQCSQPVLGMSTDIVKAFNALPRHPIFCIAEHVGFPQGLLTPWRAFLSQNRRRFKIRDCVSKPVISVTGFPEGCPLSPVAMLLAGWAYHVYMQAFAPAVRSLSFVDNLSCTAESLPDLARGISATQCFCEVLDLQLDEQKSFTWSTAAADKPVLLELGYSVVTEARELGGIMSFRSATRNQALVNRILDLSPMWQALRKSRAPLGYKLSILPAKFWARALHGIAGCPLGEGQLQKLRTAATAALNIRPGGASSFLRLALAPNLESDPGFFQLWVCVRDLRRMSRKLPNFLSAWRTFMSNYDGQLFHGPLSKLLQVLSQVHWQVAAPPWIVDEEGLCHNVLTCPEQLLRRLLEKAWLGRVGHAHRHRKQMRDLHGLDASLLRADVASMTALDSARLAAVRSGAFLFHAQQSKFDLTKSGLCAHCGATDSVEHRVRFCPHYAEARRDHAWVCDLWEELPVAFTHHLLPPANPFLPAVRATLHALPDLTAVFYCTPAVLSAPTPAVHLFTDGSCQSAASSDFALAAWGVVLAGEDKGWVVSSGLLSGLHQTAPRAELTALLSASRWAQKHQVRATIWVDSKSVVGSAQALLQGRDHHHWENADLWQQVSDTFDLVDEGQLTVRHTPGHLDEGVTESPFEDWLAKHNGHADLVAGVANRNRAEDFLATYEQAQAYHHRLLRAGRALRAIFFGIADKDAQHRQRRQEPEDHEVQPEAMEPAVAEVSSRFSDLLPVGWQQMALQHAQVYPWDFVQQLCAFVYRQDTCSEAAFQISWLELLFMWRSEEDLRFPFQAPDGKWLSPAACAYSPPTATVAGQLAIIRRAAKLLFKAVGVEELLVSGLDRTNIGVGFRLDGCVLGCDVQLLQSAQNDVRSFTFGRQVGGLGALARPC